MDARRQSELRQLPDRELVIAFKAGDLGAYDEIFTRYASKVRRICSRKLSNPLDAEEATQETFLKAFQALGRFNGNYQLAAWLNRIATNVCIDAIRTKYRTAATVQLGDQHEGLQTTQGPELEILGDDPRVEEAISLVKPIHARALQLRAIHGLSHDEMANQLAMTPSQVKALLHRARTSFRRAWDQASSWVWAPLLRIRDDSDKPRHLPHTGDILAAGQSFTVVADRILASAVLVAVAMVSPSPAPSVKQSEGARLRHVSVSRSEAADGLRARTAVAASASRVSSQAPGRAKDQVLVLAAPAVPTLPDLGSIVGSQIDTYSGNEQEGKSRRDDKGDDRDVVPAPISGAVKEALEQAPQPAPIP